MNLGLWPGGDRGQGTGDRGGDRGQGWGQTTIIWTDFGILLDDSSHERVDFQNFRTKIQGKKENVFSEQDLSKCILGGGSYCSLTLTYLNYVHVENQ